jgi:hypothetical protein
VFFAYRFKSSISKLIEALTDRVKNVKGYKKTKDGHELLFSESQAISENPSLPSVSNEPPKVTADSDTNFLWPEDKTDDVVEVRNSVKEERARAYLWEYRYLNYFLLRHTQMVLDWYFNHEDATLPKYHEYWKEYIVSEKERGDVVTALTTYNLLVQDGETVKLTPKGKEYHEWRGPLPPYIIPDTENA